MVALVKRARLSSTRKAFASKGDDVTFSRFVKLKPGEVDPDAKPKKRATASKRQWKLPGMANPSIEAGRSIFHRNGVVRWSNKADEDEWSTRTVVEPFSAPDAVQCPEQVGLVDGCGKCGLCWNTKKNIAFTAH